MDTEKLNLKSWDSNDDFLRRVLKQHSSSQATIQILQSQLQRLKTLKGTSKKSLQKSKLEEELMESSTNDLILSTSQTFDTNNNQQEERNDKFLCSTMKYNKTNNLNPDNFGDGFSPIKENVKIEEFLDSQENLTSAEDPASSSQDSECEEKVDELSSLFETIMKTGEKLKKELKESRRRELILSQKLSNSKSSNSHSFHHTKPQPLACSQPCGDNHDVTDQLDLKFQCSKLENALLSLQNENLKLNRVLKRHRPSTGNNKLPEVAEVISRLRESEIEKVEMQLEMEKMKHFIKQSNLKKCSCDRIKVDELKSSLRKSHEMLEEGINQRKQLHSLLAHKESQLTDMQVKIDKLELALQTTTNKMKKLEQQQDVDNNKSITSEKEGISKKEIEELLVKYEQLKEVHLQTLKDFHELARRVKQKEDEQSKKANIENVKKSGQTETPCGKTYEILGEYASSVDAKLDKPRDYPSYLQLRADQANRRNRHDVKGDIDASTSAATSQSGDIMFVEESTPRCKLKMGSTISSSSCINDLAHFRLDCLQSTPVKTKETSHDIAGKGNLPHEFCTRNNTHTTRASCSSSNTRSDLPTDTMSLLEKFHDFTVALVDQDGLANSAGHQASARSYSRDLQTHTHVDELLRHNDVSTTTSHDNHERLKENEIGFSNSQQEYVDGLVEKYNRLARDRW